jgi:hypothetical protein
MLKISPPITIEEKEKILGPRS